MTDTDELTLIDKKHWIPEGLPVIVPQQRNRIVECEGDRGGREYRSLSRPIDRYVAHGYITGKQYHAGKRFHSLHHYSILRERYVRMPFGDEKGDFDLESLALAPRDYLAAYEAIKDGVARSKVVQVCLEENNAGNRKGMALLRIGLDYLVAHFAELKKQAVK